MTKTTKPWILALALLASACGQADGSSPTATSSPDAATTMSVSIGTEAEDQGLDLSAGSCLIEEMAEYQGEERPALTANVACSEPHAAEVVAVVTAGSFLDAREECKEVAAADHPDIGQERFYPMGPIVRGGTEYACLYASSGEAGSIRDDG